MKRKSVSIKNEKLMKYIEDISNKLGVSETFFVEKIIEKNMKNDEVIKKSIKNHENLFFSLVTINDGSEKSKLKLSHEDINETLTLSLSSSSIIKGENDINKVNVISEIRRFLLSELNEMNLFFDHKNVNVSRFKGMVKNEEDIVTLFLLNISEITILSNKYEYSKIRKLKELHEEAIFKIDTKNKELKKIQNNIYLSYSELESEISKICDNHIFQIRVRFNGIMLPIVMDDDMNLHHNCYDYLNIKYLSYRSLKQYVEYKNNFIYLLKGNYGFFYCNIFEIPKISSYFKGKFNELKNKNSNRKNLGTFVTDDSIIKFTPDYPEIKKESKLLKKILEIRKQKAEMQKKLFAAATNLELEAPTLIGTQGLNTMPFKD